MAKNKYIETISIIFVLEITNPDTNETYKKEIEFNDNDLMINRQYLVPRIGEKVFINKTSGIVTDVIYHYHKDFDPYVEVRVKVTEPLSFEKWEQIINLGEYTKVE